MFKNKNMSDEKEEKQITNLEIREKSEVQPLEAEKKPKIETFGGIAEEQALEISKGVEIVKKQKEVDGQTLIINEANEEETREFQEGQFAIDEKLENNKNEYEEEIQELQKDIPSAEGRISEIKNANKIINNDKNMENEKNIGGREKEILSRLETIRNEKEQLFSSKMESDEKRSKLKILEQEERELNKEFNAPYNIATGEEKTVEPEIPPVDIKDERLSKEELCELEKIIKEVDVEIAFLKVSTDARKEKIGSVEKQLDILKEILPKFHTANYEESQLFREANRLNGILLQFKKEPYLLG